MVKVIRHKRLINGKVVGVKEHERKLHFNPYPRSGAFHLPYETAIYVPSTQDISNPIGRKRHKKRAEDTEDFLAKKVGGFTKVEAGGGYALRKDGKLKKIIKEPVIKVTAFSTKDDWKKRKGDIMKFIKNKGKEWGQDSMGFEFEGDLYYYDVPKKK